MSLIILKKIVSNEDEVHLSSMEIEIWVYIKYDYTELREARDILMSKARKMTILTIITF